MQSFTRHFVFPSHSHYFVEPTKRSTVVIRRIQKRNKKKETKEKRIASNYVSTSEKKNKQHEQKKMNGFWIGFVWFNTVTGFEEGTDFRPTLEPSNPARSLSRYS